jgi:hypothetical protein
VEARDPASKEQKFVKSNLELLEANACDSSTPPRGVPSDPWNVMFDAARAQAEVDTDLVTYWFYEGPI